jgi:4-amino-4-deoxy-L-arabinose transferase-like glycosyltransferase
MGRGNATARSPRWLVATLAAVALARLASLPFYPLTDNTEARYANIARVMLETGDWITLQSTPGAVFWGKPPLYAWSSAASMWVFGLNEFGSRLASLAFAALTLWVVFRWATAIAERAGRERPRETGLAAALVLATCVGFFVASGAVMTDPPLLFATTWALASFWRLATDPAAGRPARLAFFAALGVGLLAKGPVAVALVAIPICAWCLFYRRWGVLRTLPWISGLALTLAIAAPWYVAAELKTPGFLRYFLVGENLQRFLVTGWKGDLYGFSHAAPHGAVWLYFAAATLPWSLLAVPAVVAAAWRKRAAALPEPELSFLWIAMLSQLAFFTISSHLIWTYALPALPTFSILVGLWLRSPHRSALLHVSTLAASAVAVALAAGPVGAASRLAKDYSTLEIYRAWGAAQATAPGPLIFEQHRVVPSLLFYSDGAARSDVHEDDETALHYDVYSSQQAAILDHQPPECASGRAIVARTRDYVLVREAGLPSHCDFH